MPLKILTGLFALAMTPLMAAAGETTVGPYTIRYSALSSSFLPQATTDKLGIGRSLRQGVINVTVLEGQGAHASSVPAEVTGTAATLTGSRVAIRFRQINDDGGQSWIGTFTVPGNDTLRFDLDVTPQGGPATHVQFTHDYIVD
ncbi:MAG: DUF4426 domain-containing protein [Rhodanobacteraceae bacterium]